MTKVAAALCSVHYSCFLPQRALLDVFCLCVAGFLISLLTHLTHHHTHGLCRDADTQTTSMANYGESLGTMKPCLELYSSDLFACKFLMYIFSASTVEKMKMIDKEYESFNYSGDRYFSFQSKLAAYRKEIEAQVQAEMNTKVHFFTKLMNQKLYLYLQ